MKTANGAGALRSAARTKRSEGKTNACPARSRRSTARATAMRRSAAAAWAARYPTSRAGWATFADTSRRRWCRSSRRTRSNGSACSVCCSSLNSSPPSKPTSTWSRRLMSLRNVMPDKIKETARQVIAKVVAELMERLERKTAEALRGAVDRSRRTAPPAFRRHRLAAHHPRQSAALSGRSRCDRAGAPDRLHAATATPRRPRRGHSLRRSVRLDGELRSSTRRSSPR